MMDENSREDYDSLLGGKQILPPSIRIDEFFTSRIQEIKALTEVVENPSNAIGEVKAFPKHMRRRAMSHNIKRIPKRLRELHAALREKSNTREGASKIPRRKYRRRPKELLSEFNRRQRKYIWLETHIWHAKRFKMIDKWGYKVPFSPNDKSYRACYRATANHCLLQDISYYNCIEISGPETTLLTHLSKHCNTETGLTFAAQACITGAREGSAIFYQADNYPHGMICEVSFIWKPVLLNESSLRTIWIWCHPGSYPEFLKELINTFNLTKVQSNKDTMEVDDTGYNSGVEMKKIELRNVPFVRTPKYSNDLQKVMLVELKDTLNKFRLIGPLSNNVLSQCFKTVTLDKCSENDDWVQRYYSENDKQMAYDAQVKLWDSLYPCYSPGQITPRSVIPLTIVDPRLHMPTSRNKVTKDFCTQELFVNLTTDLTYLDSPLWSYSIRDTVTKSKLSTEQINSARSEKLVPGMKIECLEENQQNLPCFPIMLIQRPGSQSKEKRLGFGSGWDVISPCSYGMPLWLSFILSGARAGGLREAEAFCRESGIQNIYQQPDTCLGKLEENEKFQRNTETFFSLPPAKRHNYIKLNIPTPFHCPWSILTKDWDGTEDYYVMRNIKLLTSINKLLRRFCPKDANSVISEMSLVKPGALIPIKVNLSGKGILGPNAHICLLQMEDIQSPPTETQKKDDFHEERKKKRTEHKCQLKKLHRKRHKAKLAIREEKSDPSNTYKQIIKDNCSKQLILEHLEKMKKLWLPSCNEIKNICIRPVIGFVTNGDFCFTEGYSSGIGYTTVSGLKQYFIDNISNRNIILIRNTNTCQYRLASFNVIV